MSALAHDSMVGEKLWEEETGGVVGGFPSSGMSMPLGEQPQAEAGAKNPEGSPWDPL